MLASSITSTLAPESFYNVESLASSPGWEMDHVLGGNTMGNTDNASTSKSIGADNRSGYISKSSYVLSRAPVSLAGVGTEVYLVLTLLLELSAQPDVSASTRNNIDPHTETPQEKTLTEHKGMVFHNIVTLERVWEIVHLRSEYALNLSPEIMAVEADVKDSTRDFEGEKFGATSTTGVVVTATTATLVADTTETNKNVTSTLNLYLNPDEGLYREMVQGSPEIPHLQVPKTTSSLPTSPEGAIIQKGFIPFGPDLVPTTHCRTLTIRTNAFFTQIMPYLPVVCELTHTQAVYGRAEAVNGLSMSTLTFTGNSTHAKACSSNRNNKSSSSNNDQYLQLGVDKAVALVLELMSSPIAASSSIANRTS
jgi:hypothetical protein